MNDIDGSVSTDPFVLMEIIRMQTEIAKLGLDLGGVVGLVVDRMQSLTNAQGAIVEFAEGEQMVYRGASGIAKPLLGLRVGREGSLSGLCVREGKAVRSDDIDQDPRVDREPCRMVGIRSMVAEPLDHNGTKIGVLKIVSTQPNSFGARDIRVLELMCELIAAAMFHATRTEASQLYYQATHDGLTGLANRAAFYDKLRQRLSMTRRQSDNLVGLLVIDMDGLKLINDHFGHRTGDAALREMAQRILRCSRDYDSVCRIGGDEFGVILPDIPNRGGAVLVADRIASEMSQPFDFQQHSIPLSASVGIAIYPDDGIDLDALLDSADQSMYAVKRTRACR